MSFNGTRELTIAGSATNVVHGDQHNSNKVIHVRIQRGVQRVGRQPRLQPEPEKDAELDMIDEYHQFRRGDIYKVDEICSGYVYVTEEDEDGQLRGYAGSRIFHRVKLRGSDRTYTSVTYTGGDISKLWKADFKNYSQSNSTIFQLFAINRSEIPALIFYDDLIPMANFFIRGNFWVWFLAHQLGGHLGCPHWDIWLNTQNGNFSRGPSGLCYRFSAIPKFTVKNLRSTAEMLKTDTWVRYLSETESQRSLDDEITIYAEKNSRHTTCIGYPPHYTKLADVKLDEDDKSFMHKEDYQRYGRHFDNPVDVPVPDDLRFDSVYCGLQAREVARIIEGIFDSWTIRHSNELFGRKLTEDGLTRFTFDLKKPITGCLVPTHYSGKDVRRAWLTQAYYVINAGEDIEDLKNCFTASFSGELSLQSNGAKVVAGSSIAQRNSPSQLSTSGTTLDNYVVYLFVSPPPKCISEVEDWVNTRIAFWSFEENGVTQIPEDMRQRLDLPRLVLRGMNVKVMKWGQCIYDAMYTWQVARGFDPTTNDFARSLGLPIFEPVTPKESRIQEIIEEVGEPVELAGSQSETTSKEKAGLTSSNFAALSAYHERYVGVSLTLGFLLIFILVISLFTSSLPLS